MRIVHVVDSLEFGGLERVVTDLALEQKRRGHEVSVFSLMQTQGLRPELEAAGIPVVIGDKRKPFDLQLIRRLRAHLRDARIEVAHTHSFVPNYYCAAARLGMGRRVAMVGTCHDMGHRLGNRRLRWMYRASLATTARVAMVGRMVHERFVGAGWVPRERAAVVLNGIPVERFRITPQRRQAARERLGLAADTPVIGAVGRLVPLKNHRLLIAQMPALVARWPDLRLVIIGGGPLEQDLARQVEELGLGAHVQLASQRSDVSDLLPAFDIFAMPSLTEGLSIALLEACATGLAIVATRVGGNPEIIDEGRTGLLVPSEDGPALHDALVQLLETPALRERMGSAAAQWVQAHASIASVATTYERLYKEATAAN